MKRLWNLALLCGIMTIVTVHVAHSFSAESQALTLPPGFAAITVASGLSLPVDIAFLPSGDLFVAEKGTGADIDGTSHVRLVRNGVVLPQPVLTLSTNVYWDSGLLALVLDPGFADNGYFYVRYATGQNALNWSGQSVVRLSRFTWHAENDSADPASEKIILETAWAHIHHGNSLLFDDAGNLLVGVGDLFNAPLAPDLHVFNGKILRIRPTEDGYTIPDDNPYRNDPEARPEIFASGVRNPYRLVQRQQDDLIVVGDVGAQKWEEIDVIQATANYGWPVREGPCPAGETLPCPPADPALTDPVATYPHVAVSSDEPTGSITGLTFYEGDHFPAEYHDRLFFADYSQLLMGIVNLETGVIQPFATGLLGVVDMVYHNQGFYVVRIFAGEIVFITYTGSDNQLPTVELAVDSDSGPAPHLVTFSASATDPDDPLLTYEWDFGDGSPTIMTSTATVTHTYLLDGTYSAQLKVRDTRGGESATVTQQITVYSGEFPHIMLEIIGDESRDLYHGGDAVLYQAQRSSLSDLDPVTPYTWRIDLHHNSHIHPLVTDLSATAGVFDIPAEPHDNDWHLWYEFVLMMHTADGQTVTVRRELHPAWVDLMLTSEPAGVALSVNGFGLKTPDTLRAIVGIENNVTASPTLERLGRYRFDHWLWQGTISTDLSIIVTTPIDDAPLTAYYRFEQGTVYLPIVSGAP